MAKPSVRDVEWPIYLIDDALAGADGVRTGDVNRDGLPDIVTGWEPQGADAFSRFILCACVPTSTGAAVIQSQINELFRRHGFLKVIKSDNRSPFACTATPLGLTRLSAVWVAFGIEQEQSRLAHPHDKGAHEPMHQHIEIEVSDQFQTGRLVELLRSSRQEGLDDQLRVARLQ